MREAPFGIMPVFVAAVDGDSKRQALRIRLRHGSSRLRPLPSPVHGRRRSLAGPWAGRTGDPA